MNDSMEVLMKVGFALVQSPIKRGSDGKATLKGAEAVLNGNHLNGDAINAGSVVWFPGDKLRFKSTVYHAIDRLIQSYGVAWGAGTLVPLAKLDQLIHEFEIEKGRFMNEVDLLQPVYDRLIDDHKSKQPAAVQSVIDAVRLPWDTFRATFKIHMPTPSVFQPLTDDLNGCANEIVDTAMDEISKDAQGMINRLLGKSQIDPKSIKPIKRLAEKCKDFAILHPAFGSFSDAFDTLAATLVPPLVGDKQMNVLAYLGVLADPQAINTWMTNNQAEVDGDLLNSIFNPAGTTSVAPAPVFTPATVAAPAVTVDGGYDWESFGI